MRHINLQAEDIVLEIADKVNALIDIHNKLEDQGVFFAPPVPPAPISLKRAIERDAQKED